MQNYKKNATKHTPGHKKIKTTENFLNISSPASSREETFTQEGLTTHITAP